MDRLENRYEIKRLLKSTDEDYIKSLCIYNEYTPVDIKTNTNEITYWLDNQTTQNDFELLLFALYLDGQIIGFAMLVYFTNRRAIVYDYIAMYSQYRVNAAYFAYMSLINSYIITNNILVDYFAVEISNKNEGLGIDKESLIFQKLLCLEGFGVVDTQYITLPIGIDNFESSFNAFLYVKKSGDKLININRDTILNIVKGIYYDYFKTWYSKFLNKNEIDLYIQKIDSCYKTVEEKIGDLQNINVISPKCELPTASKHEEPTDGVLPAKQIKRFKEIYLIFAAILTIPILIVLIYYCILNLFNIPLSSVNSMLGNMVGAVMSFIIAYFITHKKKL